MKRLLYTISVTAALCLAAGCYDDSAITARLDKLDERVSALNSMATDFGTIRILVSNMENRALITQIIPEGEKYKLVFSNGTVAYIGNGQQGAPGDSGQQGTTGTDGQKGTDGNSPVISVKADAGVYYWTADGEWLLDSGGGRIPAGGTTPEIKIENGIFYASFDGGKTWTAFGSGSSDADSSLFLSFSKDENGTVIITLADGTVLEFPVEGGFAFTMDETTVSCKAGDVIKVKYNVFGCDDPKVYCHAEGGYIGKIVEATKDGGFVEINVTNGTRGGRMLLYATNGDNTLVRGFDIDQTVLDPTFALKSEPVVTYASVAFKYALENIPDGSKPAAGICWGTKANPTKNDSSIACPDPTLETVYQAVPSPLLEPDTQYHFRGYVTVNDKTWYSDDFTAKLAAQPEAITFNWTEEPEAKDFPASVKVYKTTDPLNGYPFNAWYAIADLSAIECRANLKSASGPARTLEQQYESDASNDKPFVLINGGYFGMANGDAYGSNWVNSSRVTTLYDITGADSQRYSVSRGIIGFNSAGAPFAGWCYAAGIYTYPTPNIVGQAPYSAPGSYSWTKEFNPAPKSAISAGPMLLKDGKILPEFTKTDKGYFLNNFEVIAGDIFSGHGSDTDRTAIGLTADNKVVLFVCDGRCDDLSQGADLDQLAQILKGLGCVDALNLDGGGSTAMVVAGKRVNTLREGSSSYNRPVATNFGLYLKK